MSKLYLDLRALSAVPDPYLATTQDIMRYSGINVGNFAFRHALKSLINIEEYDVVDYPSFNLAVAKEQPQSVVISCANWLCETVKFEKDNAVRASTIEKTDCPITVFGLGAQASNNQKDFKLGPNTERLAKVISERSNKMSVRDEFTLSVLEKIGVNNAVVTGCPSNFINLNSNLGSSIINKCEQLLNAKSCWQDLKIHFSEFSGGHKSSGQVLHETMEILKNSPSFYIIQSPELFPFILNEDNNIPKGYLANKPKSIQTSLDFTRFLKSKLMHFSSIDAWMDFARTCDLSIGMRIHGNMLPLQSGVPSVVIGHDSRTNGLSNIMGIPVVTPEVFIDSTKHAPSKLIEKIQTTMSEYDLKRENLGKVMFDYITNNGLTPKNTFVNFTKQDKVFV
jgi:hypothetical protein